MAPTIDYSTNPPTLRPDKSGEQIKCMSCRPTKVFAIGETAYALPEEKGSIQVYRNPQLGFVISCCLDPTPNWIIVEVGSYVERQS